MFWLPCDELDNLERYTICIAPARDENRDDANLRSSNPRSSKNVIAHIQATRRNRSIDVSGLRHIVCLALAQNSSNPTAAAPPVPATAIAVDASDVLIGEGSLNISGIIASATRCVFAVHMQLANATMRFVGY
ncbi:hypothetical protein HK405_006900 [Cladochytrium tenue]|nr:hypothetical protein HK405_006900 [Cladochytrium tenue]